MSNVICLDVRVCFFGTVFTQTIFFFLSSAKKKKMKKKKRPLGGGVVRCMLSKSSATLG